MAYPFGLPLRLPEAAAGIRALAARTMFGRHFGPYAAGRSLVRGLEELAVPVSYNPVTRSVGSIVVVAEGVEALRRAIQWKRTGRCSSLLATTVGDFPADFGGIMLAPEIDVCLMPSAWMAQSWCEDEPHVARRLRIWPAGVDEAYWRPRRSQRRAGKRVLVYWKTEPDAFRREVESVLRQFGWDPVTLRYGRYSQAEYRRRLSSAEFAVFISRSETHGIALAEAWASDVPTLAWDPGRLCYRGRDFSTVSSCPYLTDDTGRRWASLDDLRGILDEMPRRLGQFQPRNWVLENMTDAVRAAHLLEIAASVGEQPARGK
ncbi:glycosyltransferase [soil metagenome]